MRIPASRTRSASFDQSAMTPLIDIVFQLLIFFVCATTGHIREFLLPTDLAAGGTKTEIPQKVEAPVSQVRIHLRRDGDVTATEVEGTVYRPEDNVRDVLFALASAAPDVPLILEIDGDVPMGDVVAIVDICRSAGFESVHFAAQKPNS
jgi:biopolymer transport protein ExbD